MIQTDRDRPGFDRGGDTVKNTEHCRYCRRGKRCKACLRSIRILEAAYQLPSPEDEKTEIQTNSKLLPKHRLRIEGEN
jgi:hypothetical protein